MGRGTLRGTHEDTGGWGDTGGGTRGDQGALGTLKGHMETYGDLEDNLVISGVHRVGDTSTLQGI